MEINYYLCGDDNIPHTNFSDYCAFSVRDSFRKVESVEQGRQNYNYNFCCCLFYILVCRKSVSQFLENSLAVQVINYLPQPIDFYIIRVQDDNGVQSYSSKHLGQIRPEYFRIEYLNMQKSDEFWVAGYIGKEKMVYFSQIAVPNKNEDKIVEVRNYINHSLKLSAIAADNVSKLKYDNIKLSIWVTLDLLLIFLNAVLLLRRRK